MFGVGRDWDAFFKLIGVNTWGFWHGVLICFTLLPAALLFLVWLLS